MIMLTIDGLDVSVPEGSTVLDAAGRLGLAIPTLCYDRQCQPFSSCLVCVVRDERTGRLIPSCAAPAEDGMVIQTGTPDVFEARKTAVELLLSEHVGDCEGPCRRVCPLVLDAPTMLHQVLAGDVGAAVKTVSQSIALPRAVGRLCHAPCEKACRRRQKDEALAILLVERFVSESATPQMQAPVTEKGLRVAVVGAGPSGLAAAYALRQAGYGCSVFEAAADLGGTLRGVAPALLPPEALHSDLETLRRHGVEFAPGLRLGHDIALPALRETFAVVVLAMGEAAHSEMAAFGLQPLPGETPHSGAVLADGMGLVACGSMVKPRPHLVQAMADGAAAARHVAAFLKKSGAAHRRFDSHIGRADDQELAEFMKDAAPIPRLTPSSRASGFDPREAATESGRCLHCDCRKADDCRLRSCAERLAASQSVFKGDGRSRFARILQHADVIYEPGKCIRCGLCVQLTAQGKEALGLTFIGRGFDVRIGVPFDAPLSDALRQTAANCVTACPTAALAFKES